MMLQIVPIEERQTGNLNCEGWEGPCNNTNAIRYHMNTAYVDEESNYAVLCPECQHMSDLHWDEMWKEYYGSRL